MTPLLIALLLQASPPASSPAPPVAPLPAVPAAAAPVAPPPAEPEPSTEDTLAGLRETYRTTCGQTGILYNAYAELCDSLRKQISEYERKLDREARVKPAAKH